MGSGRKEGSVLAILSPTDRIHSRHTQHSTISSLLRLSQPTTPRFPPDNTREHYTHYVRPPSPPFGDTGAPRASREELHSCTSRTRQCGGANCFSELIHTCSHKPTSFSPSCCFRVAQPSPDRSHALRSLSKEGEKARYTNRKSHTSPARTPCSQKATVLPSFPLFTALHPTLPASSNQRRTPPWVRFLLFVSATFSRFRLPFLCVSMDGQFRPHTYPFFVTNGLTLCHVLPVFSFLSFCHIR